jgi:glycosyltransferase involved in cell wall biosynthesis
MRICVLSEYFYPDNTGGTGTVLSRLMRRLKDEHGVEIDVITSCHLYRGENTRLADSEDWDGIRILRVQTPKANPFSTLKRLVTNLRFSNAALAKLLKQPRYDLVLVTTAPPPLPLAAKAYRKMTKTPYLYVIYDLYPDIAVALNVVSAESRVTRTFQNLQKGWLHASSKTIVLGRCMADYLHTRYDMPQERLEVIPIGADTAQVQDLPKNTRFRTTHNLQGFVVLWAGNFGRHQDFNTILDAAKNLQSTAPQITFAMVGDGAQRGYVEQRVEKENIRNVRLFPFVPEHEFADMLASADVSLVTLEAGAEGLGVPSKFYNILASGRPTMALVSPQSEVARVIDENACGRHMPIGNALGLASALQELAASPHELLSMGQVARQTCEQKYSQQRITANFYQAMQAVVRANSPRSSRKNVAFDSKPRTSKQLRRQREQEELPCETH